MQKYDVTYVYRFYKSKTRPYLLNDFSKEIFRPCTLYRGTQRQKAPQFHCFSAITLHFWGFLKSKKREFPNLYMYKQYYYSRIRI